MILILNLKNGIIESSPGKRGGGGERNYIEREVKRSDKNHQERGGKKKKGRKFKRKRGEKVHEVQKSQKSMIGSRKVKHSMYVFRKLKTARR